jgi:4,5-DOPA dioxygenase extradiol
MTPLLFFGHGSPMNALGGRFAQEWRALGQNIPKPRAMLMVSAHWYIKETAATAMPDPQTIHDFSGFPPELYQMQYPAPGAPWLAERIAQILAPTPVRQDGDWGLDHGTWSVLVHVWPDADIPIVQLSIDRTRAPAFHYELGRMLAPLRDEGVLIAGSGDVVHNLRLMRRDGVAPFDWAQRFHDFVKTAITNEDHAALTNYEALGEDAALSIPTPEHYLPLLYVLGARAPGEPASFFTDALDLGSVSMLGVRFG